MFDKDISIGKIRLRSGTWYAHIAEDGSLRDIYYSDELRQMLGFQTREEFPDTLEDYAEYVHPDDVASMFEAVRVACLGESDGLDVEYRIRRKDRAYIWVNDIGTLIRTANGKPYLMHGAVIDVTHLKEAVNTKKEIPDVSVKARQADAAEWFGTVYDLNESARFRVDYDDNGQIVALSWNDAYWKMLGYSNAFELPQNYPAWFNTIVPDDREQVVRAMDVLGKISDPKDVHEEEFRIYAKNKSIRWLRVAARRVFGWDGKPKQVLGIAKDISNQKALELQTRIFEIFSREFVTVNIIDVINRRLRILRYSKRADTVDALSKLSEGYDYDQVLSYYIDKYVAVEDRERMHRITSLDNLVQQVSEKEMYRVRYAQVDDDGTRYYYQGNYLRILDETGNAAIVVGFRDITDIVQAELEKQAALQEAKEQAEAANHAKTAFLFNMSHDIRTPMNAIMGYRDLLEKYQDDPSRRQYYLTKMGEVSQVLLSIIDNVLEMARIEKGTLEMVESVWNAYQFADYLYSVFMPMMEKKGLKFTRKISVKHPYVYCDAGKLRDIFLNVVSNAYKYTNTGGSVSFFVEELPCDKEGWVFYQTTISDTGIGMSEDFIPKLFDPFAREKSNLGNNIEGTGLGMSIVKRLVDFLNGTIEVKSKKGEGTTFIITTPHRVGEKADELNQALLKEHKPDVLKGKRVLLAEDNDINAEIAIEILNELGMVVEHAADGKICVDMLTKSPAHYYDFILMDIQMPNMNGYEATMAIRKLLDKAKSNIPILAMTANAFDEDKKASLRAGMDGHLAKPIDVKDLVQGIAAVLENKK